MEEVEAAGSKVSGLVANLSVEADSTISTKGGVSEEARTFHRTDLIVSQDRQSFMEEKSVENLQLKTTHKKGCVRNTTGFSLY